MKAVLCNEKHQQMSIYVTAEILEDKLKIKGQDIGKPCEDFLGDSDYEYFYSFDERNTEKLLNALYNESEFNKLDLISRHFQGIDCCKKLREFSEKNGIEYSFYSY